MLITFWRISNFHATPIPQDVFAGGTDTTAVTSAWIFAELINNPDIKAKLWDEIDNKIGRDRSPSYEEISELDLLDAVVHETLRHHPIVQLGAPALVEEEIQLQDGKFIIPPGTWALLNIWGMAHDAKHWADPMRWNPQRWIDNPDLKKSNAFQPFKSGMRTCLGRFLAVTEMKFIVVSLLQRFDFEHPEGAGHLLDLTENDYNGINKPLATVRFRAIRRK